MRRTGGCVLIMNEWVKVSEEEISEDVKLEGEVRIMLHRKELDQGWLVMTIMIHDQRSRLGAVDLSTKWDRLKSISTEMTTTFVPDPEKNG